MIYVDQIHYSSKLVGPRRRKGRMWSRLFADTADELRSEAAQLMLYNEQYHELTHPNRTEPIGYYQISVGKRKEAIERGAKEFESKTRVGTAPDFEVSVPKEIAE